MTIQVRIEVQKEISLIELAGEQVAYHDETGMYYTLTESASDIWLMLASVDRSEEIVHALMDKYEVDADVCREGVLQFLHQLESLGIITLSADLSG